MTKKITMRQGRKLMRPKKKKMIQNKRVERSGQFSGVHVE
jgi:hypothetical protein